MNVLRHFFWFLLLSCAGLLSAESTSLSPAQALALEGKAARVEFVVKGVGRTGSGAVELYSEDAWDKPNCFYLRLSDAVSQALTRQGVPDPGSYYLGSLVRANGTVSSVLFEGVEGKRGVIEIGDASQLQILKSGIGTQISAATTVTTGSLIADDAQNSAPAATIPFTPTSAYHQREMLGFTLMLSPDLMLRPKERDAVYKELEKQFTNIRGVLSAEQLEVVRLPRIWIEWDNPALDSPSAFLGSPEWLRMKNINPEKLFCIEINNTRRFLSSAQRAQPWLVMHELAHVWHFKTLGQFHPGIMKAYADAMDAKLYDAVLYTEGVKKKRAYAAKNHIEYFAELTEAWFGKNDYYPFVRSELKQHDPQGYNLMLEIWGEKAKK